MSAFDEAKSVKREQSCAECHRRSQNSRKPKTKNPQGFPEGVNVRWKNLRHSRAADENHLAFDHANQNCLGSFHVQESRSGLGAGQLESDGSDPLSSLTPADVELLHRRFKQVDLQEGHQRGSLRKKHGDSIMLDNLSSAPHHCWRTATSEAPEFSCSRGWNDPEQ